MHMYIFLIFMFLTIKNYSITITTMRSVVKIKHSVYSLMLTVFRIVYIMGCT